MAYLEVCAALVAELTAIIPFYNNEPTIERHIKHAKQAIDSHYTRPEQFYKKLRDCIESTFQNKAMSSIANRTVRMTREQMKQRQQEATEMVFRRNANQVVLADTFVQERVDWLRANGLLVDDIILLLLACGARRCEILGSSVSDFEPIGQQCIKQTGFGKKTAHCSIENVEKPLLFMTSTEFMMRLHRVRREVKRITDKRIVDSFDQKLEDLSKLLWPQFKQRRAGTHICRALYVSIAYTAHAKANESIMAFASRVLGHENLSSVANYLHVKVIDPTNEKDAEEAESQHAQSSDALQPIEMKQQDGAVVRLLPMPRRRLTPDERDKLTENRELDLIARDIPLTLQNLKALGVDYFRPK